MSVVTKNDMFPLDDNINVVDPINNKVRSPPPKKTVKYKRNESVRCSRLWLTVWGVNFVPF